MAVSFRNLAPNTKVNFTVAMQVESRTRFNGFTFLSEASWVIANTVNGDARALVAQTKAYFRAGSSTDETLITYILVKQSESAKVIAIPEPLIDLNSVTVAGNDVFTITVHDSVTDTQLQQILSGNGLTDFSIVTTQV
jgi:hypothetical protein